ncbi:MAG: methylenetetrahydrofolate reductase C-terminal domain-containing protein [Spirochaetaceae bacterium]|nr:MAG: methylenetetrahydrofolate reductase C-terminal domain-containing protein [Spirochaetaceae bacterium]
MIVTEKKPLEEIIESLKHDQRVFILGCQGCPEGADTGGPQELESLKIQLEEKGKKISDTALVDFLCNKILVGMRLDRKAKAVLGSDAVLVVSCGIGVQATGAMIPRPVIPALNTLSMGGVQGLWPSAERCGECGNCMLETTGGICPVTTCEKSLLNGPCGGSSEGKCEIHSEKDCGWYLIYERLKTLERTQNLMKIQPLRNYRKMDFPMERRHTVYWALEEEEKAQPNGIKE